MRFAVRRKNFYYLLGMDSALIAAAYLLAYFLRFEGVISSDEWINIRKTFPYILGCKLFVFIGFGLYRGMWRYTSFFDLFNVLKATITASAGIIFAILYTTGFSGYSRSVFILDWILTFIFIGGVRVAIRIVLAEGPWDWQQIILRNPFFPQRGDNGKKKLIIIGAGKAGEKILREIQNNIHLGYQVIGFLDDDPEKAGRKIHGIPIWVDISRLRQIASRYQIDEILIATPVASAAQMRRIIEVCETTGLKFRTTPALGELINGKVSFSAVREVSFEDLLGRAPVDLELTRIGEYLQGKAVLISGAGGSIGSELCRQIAKFSPCNLILLDNTENNLFRLEMEFRQSFPATPITSILGDVQHREFLNKLFSTCRPQVVFHAAAYKHVPIVELNPWEGVLNNIIGTKNIVETAHRFEAERFIMVSTDKAVRPSSVMGATKRVAEMITASFASKNSARFLSVRFGNVIGSEGSVVHLFRKQIDRLGPVTVTHPDITRYFMTIPEACKLILQAGALGRGGEIFILNMGTPIRIADMARDLIRLSGYKPDIDIEIQFIGLRPGEKLHEELITEGEGIVRTAHDKIFVLNGNGLNPNWLYERIEELQTLAQQQNTFGIKEKLQEIIPEYQPFDTRGHREFSEVFPPPLRKTASGLPRQL
jgi:FlaA1/EpsC-like NDP-sugar epimerase